MSRKDRPQTPDGRYFVARGQLKRCTDPCLTPSERRSQIKALMQGRRAFMQAASDEEAHAARRQIDAAKRALGEIGPVWWDDGAPDESGSAPEASSYAAWWSDLSQDDREAGS